MSGIEDLHSLLGEQKQHIQGRVPWSESKLMIRNQASVGMVVQFNVCDGKDFISIFALGEASVSSLQNIKC